MDIEDLLKPIIARILNMMNKKALLFITGGAVNIKDIFETLGSINLLKYDIVISEAAEKIIPEQYIKNLNGNLINCKVEMTRALRETDLVIIPVMTRNTLSKCGAGISDNLVTVGISEALMMNKEIIAVKDSFDPLNPANISLGFTKNPMYNRFILDYQERLSSFGVKFIDSNDLKKSIEEKFSIVNTEIKYYSNQSIETQEKLLLKKEELKEASNNLISNSSSEGEKLLSGVLTIEDVMKSAANSKEVCVKQGSIITPLAKDYIYNNKINIKYY